VFNMRRLKPLRGAKKKAAGLAAPCLELPTAVSVAG